MFREIIFCKLCRSDEGEFFEKNILLLQSEGEICYSTQTFAGTWRNWLAHRTVDPVVAGSNPVVPATF
jgi:hypothetical protein